MSKRWQAFKDGKAIAPDRFMNYQAVADILLAHGIKSGRHLGKKVSYELADNFEILEIDSDD